MSAEAEQPAGHYSLACPWRRAVRVLLGLLLLGMVALNVANAICRYVFGIVLIGADEVLVFA